MSLSPKKGHVSMSIFLVKGHRTLLRSSDESSRLTSIHPARDSRHHGPRATRLLLLHIRLRLSMKRDSWGVQMGGSESDMRVGFEENAVSRIFVLKKLPSPLSILSNGHVACHYRFYHSLAPCSVSTLRKAPVAVLILGDPAPYSYIGQVVYFTSILLFNVPLFFV